jgi:hypothetical protein
VLGATKIEGVGMEVVVFPNQERVSIRRISHESETNDIFQKEARPFHIPSVLSLPHTWLQRLNLRPPRQS